MEIKVAETKADFAACAYIRTIVFCSVQGNSFSQQFNGEDDATHIIAYDEDDPIGTIRFRIDNYKAEKGYIERLAIVDGKRRDKVGTALAVQAMEILKRKGVKIFEISAQEATQKGALKLGFKPIGDEYEDGGMPHRKMILEV